MSVKMKFGSKDIPFVYKGDKLIYPNPIKDGLLLWYDFKGMRNTDTNKEVAKDLSGNGNDGTLTNFNFTEESGYKDNTLVFDGVDDSLTIPELELDETAMTVVQDGKIYSYEDDKVLTVGEDGEIIGSGINYIIDGFERVIKARTEGASARFNYSIFNFSHTLENMQEYILTADIEITSGNPDNVTILSRTEDREVNLAVGSLPIINGKIQKTFISNGLDKMIYFYAGASGATEGVGLIVRNLSVSKVYKENLLRYSPAPKDYKSVTLSPTSITGLQLYNKTLNKTELLHNAESKGLKKLKPGVVVQDGLVLHYDFSHESNTSEYKDKAFDYSGNGNHGVLNNFNFTEESGYEGEGLKFDGVDDYIESNNKIDDIYCLEATFIFDVEVDYLTILSSLNHTTGGQGFAITTVSSRNFRINRKATPNNLGISSFPLREGIKIGNTYHIVAQYRYLKDDDYILELYLNGEKYGEEKVTGFVNSGSALKNPVMVGKYSSPYNGYYYKKPIYSARAYNRPLTPEEIAHNYVIEKEKFNIE